MTFVPSIVGLDNLLIPLSPQVSDAVSIQLDDAIASLSTALTSISNIPVAVSPTTLDATPVVGPVVALTPAALPDMMTAPVVTPAPVVTLVPVVTPAPVVTLVPVVEPTPAALPILINAPVVAESLRIQPDLSKVVSVAKAALPADPLAISTTSLPVDVSVPLTAGVDYFSISLVQASYLPPGQQSINLLYETLLGREGDAQGLAVMENAVSSGASLRDIASGITLSPEFINGNGSLSDSGFIESMYTNELGRQSDADGFSLIQKALLSGASRSDVAVGLAGSYEAQSAHATLPFVQANNLYHTLLGRDMDTQGGTNAVGALLRGAALSDLSTGIMSSPEYFSWQTSKDTVSSVSSFYTYGLGRAPSGTETAFYVQAVGAGATIAQVAAGIASSTEALRFAGYGPVGSLTA